MQKFCLFCLIRFMLKREIETADFDIDNFTLHMVYYDVELIL